MPRPTRWEEEEIRKLKRLYPSERSFDEIVGEFPNRTPHAIRLKASRLGLRRPTVPRSEYLSSSILVCSEGNGEFKGYLIRCNECSRWIQVRNDGEADEGAIVCSNCGFISYLET
ncbi:MAG: SANT/Myb-like DNA-binding domain-containing protein [Candidatus Bathyarchaeia archaeon]